MKNREPVKTEDLMPHEWQSDREKPKEPFFGPGIRWFLVTFLPQFIIAGLLIHYVIRPMMN